LQNRFWFFDKGILPPRTLQTEYKYMYNIHFNIYFDLGKVNMFPNDQSIAEEQIGRFNPEERFLLSFSVPFNFKYGGLFLATRRYNIITS